MSPESQLIDSPRAFSDAVHWVAEEAVAQRCRRLLFTDSDFRAWPLGSERLHTALTAFVRMPGRQVVLMASRFDRVEPEHPRFFTWYRVWCHAVTALAPTEGGVELPCLAAADRRFGLILTDPSNWTGRRLSAETALFRSVDELDAFAQRCERSLPATTLGL